MMRLGIKIIFFSGIVVLQSVSLYAQADSSSVEFIKVYFDMPSDHSVALPGNESKDSRDITGTLVSLIDSAKYSVDLCIYDLEQPRIGHALVRAQKRGVRIRLLTDNYNRTDGGEVDSVMWAMLEQADIISMDDDGDVYEADGSIKDHSLVNAGADMHDKFAVVDVLSPSPQDDYVWTGSSNLTYTSGFNTNHTIVIKDNAMAAAYTREFNQMWGSNGPAPDPGRARFHKDKREVLGNHNFWVGNIPIELYFAPENRTHTKANISERIVKLIGDEAQHDVNFMAFAISPGIPMSRKMWEMSATGNIRLSGVIDRAFYGRYRNNGDIWASPEAQISNRLILSSNELRKLHEKVLIIDAANPDSTDQGVVIAGSYNFSKNAEYNNDENLLIIHSDKITNQYYQDFRGILSRAQKKTWPPAPPIKTDTLYAVKEISDGSKFSIEPAPDFKYAVRFLGVQVPSVYAGADSSYYFADVASKYLHSILKGAKVKIEGPFGSDPKARYGAFQAYVTMQKDGKATALNALLLKKGIGRYIPYYAQHPDSADVFKQYQQEAKEASAGIWKHPEKVDTKISRAKALGKTATSLTDVFPVNINKADESTLQMLPGIGPAYAKRIIAYRNEHGGFGNVDELRNIKGIGPKTMEKLRANVVTADH